MTRQWGRLRRHPSLVSCLLTPLVRRLSFTPVTLEGYYKDQIFDRRELRFEVGEGESVDLPCGLEKAIQRKEKGEHSLVCLKPSYAFGYAFGSVGKEKFQIPPNAELKYEVQLKSFEKVSLFKIFPTLKSGPTLDVTPWGADSFVSPLGYGRPRSPGR